VKTPKWLRWDSSDTNDDLKKVRRQTDKRMQQEAEKEQRDEAERKNQSSSISSARDRHTWQRHQ
jgi:hypothetical protein